MLSDFARLADRGVKALERIADALETRSTVPLPLDSNVRSIPCPDCRAPAQIPCSGVANHPGRIDAYLVALYSPPSQEVTSGRS